jgi:hypothetical protein
MNERGATVENDDLTSNGTPDEIAQKMGPIEGRFTPTTSEVFAGRILSLLMVCGGGALSYVATKGIIAANGNLPLNADKGWSWVSVGLVVLVSLILFVVGVVFWFFSKNLSRSSTFLCRDGICWMGDSLVPALLWKQITVVREIHLDEHLPILKGPFKFLMPTVSSREFEIHNCVDPKLPIIISRTTVPDIDRFAELLQEKATLHGVVWETERRRE